MIMIPFYKKPQKQSKFAKFVAKLPLNWAD
jgi:hypothetical protein